MCSKALHVLYNIEVWEYLRLYTVAFTNASQILLKQITENIVWSVMRALQRQIFSALHQLSGPLGSHLHFAKPVQSL